MSPTGYAYAGKAVSTWSSSRFTTTPKDRGSPGCGSCAPGTSRSRGEAGFCPRGRVRDQPVAGSEQAGQRAVGGAGLGVDMLDVVGGRPARDDQLLGDLLVGQATGQQLEHLHLAAGQVGRAGGPAVGGM